jgi:hypothetical protein
MRKFTLIALILLLITPATFAENIELEAVSVAVPSLISIENNVNVVVEEAQEELKYNYYHSPACGWCQKLDKFLKSHDAYEKLNINKIDVR